MADDKNLFNANNSAWLYQTRNALMATGWRVVPVQAKNGNPNPYKSAQTYRPESYKWQDGIAAQDILAVALDNSILLDYDGNKPGTIPESELAALVGTLPEPVQVRSGSKHWLFKLPAGFNPKEYKNSADGQLAQGVDVKRGNQLVYVKRGKTLPYGGTFPRREELPEAPQALIDILKITAPVRTTFDEFTPSNETTRYGSGALMGACRAISEAAEGERNRTLNIQAMKVYQRVAGGEISEADADLAIYSAADAAGLPPDEIDATMASAKRKGLAEPRKAPPRIASPDEFQRYEPIPESPQVRANKAAAAPVTPAPAESVGQPGGELGRAAEPTFQRDRHGMIEPTLTNAIRALKNPAWLGFDVRLDRFTGGMMIGGPGAWRPMKDADLTWLRAKLEKLDFKPVAKELMRDAVYALADLRAIDTAQEWLSGLVWDGVPRVAGLLENYFGIDGGPYATACSQYAMTAHAARVLEPGAKADMLIVLCGPQGYQKSTGIAALAPDVKYFSELSFKTDEDNAARKIRGRLVVEIAELHGMRGKSVEGIKAQLSRRVDSWVPKYQEFAQDYARRCLFWGTSNENGILNDPTGSRRFLPHTVNRMIDADGIARDRDQLWAEAVALYQANGVMWQDAERLARDVHADYQEQDEIDGVIEDWIHRPVFGLDISAQGISPADQGYFKPIDLYNGIADVAGLRSFDKSTQTRLGKACARLGYKKQAMRIGGKSTKVYKKL